MRILVTGAHGFVGQTLLPYLARSFQPVELVIERTDVTDASAVDALVRRVQPDVCVHLAAVSTIGSAVQDSTHAWAVNLGGTLNLARSVLRHTPQCQFVFASSATVYGASFQAGHSLDETALLAPENTYAATKAAADLALHAYAKSGLRAVRLRLFNHTGPGQPCGFVVPDFAEQVARIALGRQKPEIHVGNLDVKRDFLDVRDVCEAYVRVIACRSFLKPQSVFNICSGLAYSIQSILEDIIKISRIDARILVDPERVRAHDTPLAVGNHGLASSVLGWQPSIPWSRTLEDVYNAALSRIKLAQAEL